jgi:hypothetical protein
MIQELFKKIPNACKNMGVNKPELVANYIHNFVLVLSADPDFQKRLHEEPAKFIEELSKL